MKGLLQRQGEKMLGVLSGFDRMRFRGTLRLLTSIGGTRAWLSRAGVLLKDFVKFAEGLTKQVRQATEESAATAGRPVRYLDRFLDKEALLRRIRQEQGLGAHGLIKEIPRTHRYLLTQQGATVMAALLAARHATLAQLNAA